MSRRDSGPRSLLFLSCDIVGSTKFKQASDGWQTTFLTFYRQFPQVLVEVVNEFDSELKFDLWKPVGDELIFTCKVVHEDDVYDGVRIWLEAMKRYEVETLVKTGLAAKGGAFIATFPGPDSEATIPLNPEDEKSDDPVLDLNEAALAGQRNRNRFHFDYFGPSIDTGFRVFGACTQRHFTLSVEVTWAMWRCRNNLSDNLGLQAKRSLDDLVLFETKELRGVWRGRDYPIFALDRNADDPVNAATRELLGTSLSLDSVGQLCQSCCTSEGWPSALYLPKSDVKAFTNKPEDSLKKLLHDQNKMIGAETVEADSGEQENLETTPPLG